MLYIQTLTSKAQMTNQNNKRQTKLLEPNLRIDVRGGDAHTHSPVKKHTTISKPKIGGRRCAGQRLSDGQFSKQY